MITKLAYLIVILFSCASYSAEIVVPVNHFPPWKIVSNNGECFGGIDIQLMNMVVSTYNRKHKTNHTVRYTFFPWIRALRALETGEADIFNGVLDRPERREFLHYLSPAYKNSSVKSFYTYDNDSVSVKKYEDLYRYGIGSVNGALYEPKFDSDSNIDKRQVAGHEKLFQMLLKKRFDLIVGTESQIDYLLATEKSKDKIRKMDYKLHKKTKVYFTISKKSKLAADAEKFQAVVFELKKEGKFKEVIESFFLNLSKKSLVPSNI